MSITLPSPGFSTMEHQSILDFWFGTGDDRGKARADWFNKDPAFDVLIRERFFDALEAAALGRFDHWLDQPASSLGLIVLLDQFPRHMFRGTARAFATDAKARAATAHVLQYGFDRAMLPVERMFVYLPLEHSENLGDQDDCHRLMLQLAPFPETANVHEWAEKHRAIIRRFGRFPHRNEALGRDSTPEEIEFLKTPGSGF
jgi:uncharacterized protein (DUF924 family)